MAGSEVESKAESKAAHQNEAGPRVSLTNAIEQGSEFYEIILPFAGGKRSPECEAQVVEQTKEHWSYFTHAQHMDEETNTGLGNLSYIPLEIRRMIYNLLLFDQCTEHLNANASCHGGSPTEVYIWADLKNAANIFDFRVHNVHCKHRCSTSRIRHLQQTSSSLRNEYRDNFLTSSCFRFRCPANLREFLKLLTSHQQLQLRRLVFIVSVPNKLAGPRANYEYTKYLNWSLICSQLPTTLTSVVIEAESCEVYLAATRRNYPTPGQILGSGSSGKFKYVEYELLTTDVICKGVRKRAPNAELSVITTDFGDDDAGYLAMFNAVVARYG